jgi:hypothetical protein
LRNPRNNRRSCSYKVSESFSFLKKNSDENREFALPGAQINFPICRLRAGVRVAPCDRQAASGKPNRELIFLTILIGSPHSEHQW